MSTIRTALTFVPAPVASVHARAAAADDLFRAARPGTASEAKAALSAGADPAACGEGGAAPFDHAKDNEALRGTDVYRRLNERRFE